MDQRDLSIKLIIFLSLTFGVIQLANAVPLFLKTWNEDIYPNSNSDEIGCQLCHQSSTGGNGWNAYGTDIWFYYNEQERNIENAFRYVESINSDGDGKGLTNLEEIERSMFPGWVNSNTNTIFYKGFSFLQNQAPPFQEVDTTESNDEKICFTLIAKNKKVVLICL